MAGQRGLAKDIRVRLSVTQGNASRDQGLNDLWFGKPVRKHIWEFACVLGLVALLISASVLIKQRNVAWPFALTTLTFALLCVARYKPLWLKPVWRAFVDLGFWLGLIMTPLMLGLVWFLLFIPIALLLRAIGIRTMETRFRQEVDSYWDDRDSKHDDPKLLKRQF